MLCCVFGFVLFALRRVSSLSNVVSVSGLFILDCPFGFSLTFIFQNPALCMTRTKPDSDALLARGHFNRH